MGYTFVFFPFRIALTPPHPTPPHPCSYEETPHLTLPEVTPPDRGHSVTVPHWRRVAFTDTFLATTIVFASKKRLILTHQGHKTIYYVWPPPSVCATPSLLTRSALLFVFFHAFVFLPCPQQHRCRLGFSNAVRLRECNHGKGDVQYFLRPLCAATGCVQ